MPRTRPVIGLTMDTGDRPGRYEVGDGYIKSVEKAGGIPLAIAYSLSTSLIPDILNSVDGMLFIGGDDLDPALYGEAWHEKAIKINRQRQDFELALLAEVEHRRMSTLGICLGSQLINIHRGGSLHQFLPDLPRPNPIEHRKADRDNPEHPVAIDTDSVVGRVIGRRDLITNTFHKQAANRIGRGLRVVARAPDGIVEAMEDPTFPLFVAIQWHPERMHDVKEHLALFQLLVDTAANHDSR